MYRIAVFASLALTLSALSVQAEDKDNPVVVIETSMGTIKAELFKDKAPKTVENFLKYVDEKFYDDTIFHRVMEDFMIQGGGFTKGMKDQKKTHDPIKNEAGLTNERGTLAMARLRKPDTATCQFFINVVDNNEAGVKAKKANTNLDKTEESDGYCVFGKVTEGMDIVDKIRKVETGTRGSHECVPKSDVVIKSIRLQK